MCNYSVTARYCDAYINIIVHDVDTKEQNDYLDACIREAKESEYSRYPQVIDFVRKMNKRPEMRLEQTSGKSDFDIERVKYIKKSPYPRIWF